jgi:hypothetical protein
MRGMFTPLYRARQWKERLAMGAVLLGWWWMDTMYDAAT